MAFGISPHRWHVNAFSQVGLAMSTEAPAATLLRLRPEQATSVEFLAMKMLIVLEGFAQGSCDHGTSTICDTHLSSQRVFTPTGLQAALDLQ